MSILTRLVNRLHHSVRNAAQRSMRSTSASSMYSPELPIGAGADALGAMRLTPLKHFLADVADKQRMQERQQTPPSWATFDAASREPVRHLCSPVRPWRLRPTCMWHRSRC